MVQKLKEEAERKAKRAARKELIVKDIMYFGLFQNESQMEDGLEGLKETEKIDALKAQLRFREQVLEQEAEDQLFRFSKKTENGRRNLTFEELAKNVSTLIEISLNIETTDDTTKQNVCLIGRRIEHMFDVDGNDTIFYGKIISTVPGYPAWVNIKYDGDDSIYVERIQKAIRSGEAKLMP